MMWLRLLLYVVQWQLVTCSLYCLTLYFCIRTEITYKYYLKTPLLFDCEQYCILIVIIWFHLSEFANNIFVKFYKGKSIKLLKHRLKLTLPQLWCVNISCFWTGLSWFHIRRLPSLICTKKFSFRSVLGCMMLTTILFIFSESTNMFKFCFKGIVTSECLS